MTAIEFDQSVTEARQGLESYALRLTKNNDDAQDLLQDTVLKALSNREKFKPGTNIRAWLYTIMRNTFLNKATRAKKYSSFSEAPTENYYENQISLSEKNNAYGDFLLKDIINAFRAINDKYRVPFLMYFRGYKYEEIAEDLSIPLGTVKNRIHMARGKLQDILSDYDGE